MVEEDQAVYAVMIGLPVFFYNICIFFPQKYFDFNKPKNIVTSTLIAMSAKAILPNAYYTVISIDTRQCSERIGQHCHFLMLL